MGTIVDDLLISCAKSYGIANKCIQYLKGKYIGVSFEHEPKSFAGYKIMRSVDGTVINISMPELIEAKMKELCPELVSAKARKEFKALHAGGDKLQKLADGMVMEAPRADGKRTKHCMIVMSLTGCIRYFLRASAGELNVIAHRLSSIMARAPPEAITVAKAAIIMAYEQRERGITYSAHDHHPKSEEPKTSSLEVSFATGVPREPNRAITGYFVGIEHTVYLVYNAVTRKVTKEPFVWAIDELELARGGLAAGALLHDSEVQCEIITGTPLTLMPSPAPVKFFPKLPETSRSAARRSRSFSKVFTKKGAATSSSQLLIPKRSIVVSCVVMIGVAT
jgi:hypothetical protein